MRSELREALGRIHGKDYDELMSPREKNKGKKSNGSHRRSNGQRKAPNNRASRAVISLVVIILVATLIYTLVAGVYYFNQFSLIAVDLDQYESLVENELRRRANLLPNLLIISAEYRRHEKQLYEYVSEMRTQLATLKKDAPSEVTIPLSNLMSSLLAIAEQYPDLKATQSFEQLMADWTETEDRIRDARVSYIQSIRQLNALCTTFPSNLYADFFNVEVRDPFKFDDLEPGPVSSEDFFSSYLSEGAENEQ